MIVMFADLAGYTALTDVHGDEEAVAAVEAFRAVVTDAADRHRLRVIKGIGDAFLLIGDDGTAAMTAAQDVVEKMAEIERAPAVRVGIHEGPVTEQEGDVFGHSVNVAARVASEARAGQVLITPHVLTAAQPPLGVEPLSVGHRTFRNVSAPIELFDITHDRSSGKFIDPICQMLVSAEGAAGTIKHEGQTLYFCSVDCIKRFVEANGRGATQ
jgi:class 3 adenylate cyclase